MIPEYITRAHIAEAVQRVIRDGVPPRRKGRGYCLVAYGSHLPPKYTISLAHQVAMDEWLHPDQFSGGQESNEFLRRRGFNVAECACGGSVLNDAVAPEPVPPAKGKQNTPLSHRGERCPACKVRVAELLERVYGTCVRNHGFGWPAALAPYAATAIGSVLRDVAQMLEAHRGYGVGTFVRRELLAPCDYWVPNPGFILEFDESQHFTSLRRLVLSAYQDMVPLGFSARRWMELCEHHDAHDNHPLYRDEQRAWYDTLRDLVPSIRDLQPTVRLYASDWVWCSLDPDRSEDRKRFLDLLREERTHSNRVSAKGRSATVRAGSKLLAAMVFPPSAQKSSNGVPPSGPMAQQPDVPTVTSFAGEAPDFVLFPEAYISVTDQVRTGLLRTLALDLGAPLLVGAIDRGVDSSDRAWQVLLRFDPDGSCSRVYTKHSTANAVAFELPDWESSSMLPTFELGDVTAGATICHDHYLGLLPHFLAKRGAHIWINPSFDNVNEIKWSSILRLRAVENRFFSLCTLHCDVSRPSTHPYGFSPDGSELSARPAGSEIMRPLSQCCESGKIYVVDLDSARAGEPLDWSKLPPATNSKSVRKAQPLRPIRVGVRDGQPAVLGCLGQSPTDSGLRIQSPHGSVYAGFLADERILNAGACFGVLDQAREMNCAPIIWNHWDRLPTDSVRFATLMMGRAIECCAPVVLSDRNGIHELVELSNNYKIPARRAIESSGDATVDMGYAWGLDSAFCMVTKRLTVAKARTAMDRYRSLR